MGPSIRIFIAATARPGSIFLLFDISAILGYKFSEEVTFRASTLVHSMLEAELLDIIAYIAKLVQMQCFCNSP